MARIPQILLLALIPASACDCPSGRNACETAARHNAVFVGTIISSEPGTTTNGFGAVHRIRVEERFIGDLPAEVRVGDGIFHVGCGSLHPGKEPMIIYANGSPTGILRTSMCGTRNIPAFSPPLPDLEQLRALRTFRELGIARDPCAPPAPPPGRASIEGRILDAAGQPAGTAVNLSLRHPGEPKPIYKATLSAGVFRFTGVAAGRYVLHLDRTFYRTPYRPAYYPGAPSESTAQVIDVPEAAGLRLPDWRLPEAQATITIRGSVSVPGGSSPLYTVFLQSLDHGHVTVAHPREDGVFEFVALAGERYQIYADTVGAMPTRHLHWTTIPTDGQPVNLQLNEPGNGLQCDPCRRSMGYPPLATTNPPQP